MPSFRTELPPQRSPFAITHTDRLLLVGSCFTGHIGDWLAAHKFPTLTNPFGIVYNPLSMARCLARLAAGKQEFGQEDLFENAGLWHSWEHHGCFSQPDAVAALAGINAAYHRAAAFLKTTNRLLLTFGTAHTYFLKDDGAPVANCHKVPAGTFERRLLPVSEITAALWPALENLLAQNADLQIILTVSPVRHLRDGFVENQRSKAALLLACAELAAARPNRIHYFPAYELLLDDLRDYRFYAPDLVHPNEVAVGYVRDHFAATFFPPETQVLAARIGKLRAAMAHRPFHADSAAHRNFVVKQIAEMAQLKEAWPGLDWREEERWDQGT